MTLQTQTLETFLDLKFEQSENQFKRIKFNLQPNNQKGASLGLKKISKVSKIF